MKCQKIQRIVISTEESTWAAEIRTHVSQCPECGQIHRRTTFTHDLIALKQYEVPDADAEARCVDQVHARIDQLRQEGGGSTPIPFVLPAPVYGIAAVCLILLGVHLSPTGTPESLETVITDAGARTFEQFLIEGPRDWRPYFNTMPTDEYTFPASIYQPRQLNSIFRTNSAPMRR